MNKQQGRLNQVVAQMLNMGDSVKEIKAELRDDYTVAEINAAIKFAKEMGY